MKLSRTKEYNFGWLVLLGLVDVAFLLVFFLLLSSNFILQPGISVAMPFSRFTLGPQINQQIISITGGAVPAIYFREQKITLDQLGPLLDAAKREGRSIIVKAERCSTGSKRKTPRSPSQLSVRPRRGCARYPRLNTSPLISRWSWL